MTAVEMFRDCCYKQSGVQKLNGEGVNWANTQYEQPWIPVSCSLLTLHQHCSLEHLISTILQRYLFSSVNY